jgi:large subunit ribosomal protein L10
MPSQQILQEKKDEVTELTQLVNKYKSIGIASLKKVRAAQMQELKKNLADKVFMRVIKNTLMRLAIKNSGDKPGLEKIDTYLTGPNVFLFTDINPFKLVLALERGKVKTTAKAKDVAAFDVIVPAGNTGQPPGPMISQLNSVGLPTRIESGSVWVSKDTLVVKKGEVINERLASVLSKLGIKPVETGLAMTAIYDDGLVIVQDQLRIDVDATKHEVESAFADSFALSLSISYPMPENSLALVQIAHREAYTLALAAEIPTRETIVDLIRKANMEMLSLSSRMPKLEEKTAKPVEKTEKS